MSDRDSAWLNDYLMQVGHAFNMAAELPGWLESGEFASPRFFHPWHAVGEAWLLNARLLAEFFLDGGRKSDVGPQDYLEGARWVLDDDEQRAASIRSTLTTFATGPNKHTMHFDAVHRGATPLWSPPATNTPRSSRCSSTSATGSPRSWPSHIGPR